MTLDIDITEKNSREIMEIMHLYQQGHLEIKFERVLWVSDSLEPMSRCGPESSPGYRGPSNQGKPGLADGMRRAADVLGSMVCPPAPQRR